MKKILQIVSVTILFIASGLIFWAGLAPESFSQFFNMYPNLNKTINQIGNFNTPIGKLLSATSSEPVLGSKGQISIKNSAWDVEIASNETARTNGLSNRRTLYSKSGMLFVFNKMGTQSFWMKDMLIPLDMIFFDNNWKIVLIEKNLQSSSFPKTFGGEVKSQYVLEINAGEADSYGLQVGNQAVFLNK